MKSRPALTSDVVRRIMEACRNEAASNSWKAAVVVVDDGGAVLMAERHDALAPIAIEVALAKARTAAITRRPTQFWEERAKERPGFLTFPVDIMIQGGLPLMHQGECVGAIGVSGVQSKEDEQIARAGVEALARES
jgi:glc operon protein GlcG